MSLLDYTHVGNGQDSVMPSDAALLSLLPFGLGRRDALTQYYSSERNGNRSLKSLVDCGMLEEHTQTIQSSRRDYVQVYYTLTNKGLTYIAEKYWDLFPFLEMVIDKSEDVKVSFLRGLSPGTVRSLLTAHACDVFFDLTGTETILTRIIFEPELAMTAMQAHLNTTNSEHTTVFQIYRAYRVWFEGLGDGTSEPVSVDRLEYKSRFFDATELKVPDQSPYRRRGIIVHDGPVIPERRERMAGHVGLLKTQTQLFIVFRSSRDGCSWNSRIIKKSWKYFCAEALRLGLISNLAQAPSVFPAILFVDGVGSKVSSFQRAITDPCHLRRGRDRVIGKGVSSLHAFPLVREGRFFCSFFANSTTLAFHWISDLSSQLIEKLFERAPVDKPYPLIYRNQLPCYFGLEMDLHQVNLAIESEQDCAIVCLDWQVPYIQAVAPNAHILVLDADSRTVIEYQTDLS